MTARRRLAESARVYPGGAARALNGEALSELLTV